MGKLMAEMMVGVEAPAPEETQAIVAYHPGTRCWRWMRSGFRR